MAYDEEFARRLRAAMPRGPGITEKRMFGGLAFLANGHMVVGVNGDTLMARVGPEAYAAALRQPHAREMDFTGRPLRGYVYVDAAGTAADRDLKRWVTGCLAFAQTLPPKDSPKGRRARNGPKPA